MNIFTKSEKTVKKYKLELAVNQARAVLLDKRCKALCTTMIQRKSNDRLYTLVEISEIINDLVHDTLYHEGY